MLGILHLLALLVITASHTTAVSAAANAINNRSFHVAVARVFLTSWLLCDLISNSGRIACAHRHKYKELVGCLRLSTSTAAAAQLRPRRWRTMKGMDATMCQWGPWAPMMCAAVSALSGSTRSTNCLTLSCLSRRDILRIARHVQSITFIEGSSTRTAHVLSSCGW